MRDRRRAIVASSVVVASAALTFHGVALSDPRDRLFFGVVTTALLAGPAIGGLILVRRPDNRIGWLFLVMGIGSAVSAVIQGYAYQATLHGSPFERGVAGWLALWSYLLYWTPAALLLLLFPTGRHQSPRWKLMTGGIVLGGPALVAASTLGRPSFEVGGANVTNPFVAQGPVADAMLALAGPLDAALFVVLTAAAASVLLRLRNARGVERQQLKWFVSAGGFVTVFILLAFFTSPPFSTAFYLLAVIGLGAGLPLAAGIAILRYRLYDIDVVIRRTIVYVGVVATLGAIYVALVLALQAALSGATGGGSLPVAVSTLVIAALFGPVRRRVRDAVDRRFYRSRYDAQRTIESLARQLRDEVDLEAVGGALRATAASAVRPTAAGVWLRERGR